MVNGVEYLTLIALSVWLLITMIWVIGGWSVFAKVLPRRMSKPRTPIYILHKVSTTKFKLMSCVGEPP